MYTQIIIKIFFTLCKKFSSSHKYIKKFCLLSIRMVNPQLNLSWNELKLIAEYRNISNYEKKSAKDLIKALRGPKPKLGIKKNKLKEIKEDFYNSRHRFSKKKQISIENFFMILKITDIFLN